MFERAQTETVGIVLVTALVILLTSTMGFVVVESMMEADSRAPFGDYRFDATETGISVTNAGGESIPLSELALVVVSSGDSENVSFTEGSLTDGGTIFQPGVTWRYGGESVSYNHTVELDLLVVHRPSGTVVDQETVTVEASPEMPTETPTVTPSPPPAPTGTPTSTPTPPETQTPTLTPTETPQREEDDSEDDSWNDEWEEFWEDIWEYFFGDDGESGDDDDDFFDWWPW